MDLTPSPHIRMLDRPLTFDPRGDLTLIVGKAKREYLVDARSLARASDVWAKMLFGPFAESKPKQADAKWTVSLPEDDDSAMLILLDIIHADFASVPEQLSLDELFDVTVLTDKYKLTSRLAPWASRWFRCVQHKSGSDEKLLWIVWELGEETVFRRIAKTFVMSSTINEDGELLLPTGVNPTVSPSPPELLERILVVRAQVVEQLVDLVREPLRNWTESRIGCCQNRQSHEQGLCNSMILGSFFHCLPDLGISPFSTEHPELRTSIDHLSKTLLGMRINTMNGYYHNNCSPRGTLDGKIRSILDPIDLILDEAHLQHLKKQKELSGIN